MKINAESVMQLTRENPLCHFPAVATACCVLVLLYQFLKKGIIYARDHHNNSIAQYLYEL